MSIKSKCYTFFCNNTLCGSKNMNEKCIKWVWEWPPEYRANTKTLLCTLSETITFSFWIHLCTLTERKFFRLIFRFPFLCFLLGKFSKVAYLVPCGFGGTAGRESVVEFGRELRWLESPLLVLACDRHFEYDGNWQLSKVKRSKASLTSALPSIDTFSSPFTCSPPFCSACWATVLHFCLFLMIYLLQTCAMMVATRSLSTPWLTLLFFKWWGVSRLRIRKDRIMKIVLTNIVRAVWKHYKSCWQKACF